MRVTKLCILILTCNSLDTLKVLVEQVKSRTNSSYRLYIVEDGQRRDTIDYLNTLKGVTVIWHKKNKGIAPSWNDGLKQAYADGCSHFVVMNDDIEVPKNWWNDCKEIVEQVSFCDLNQPSPRGITGWFFILDRECIDKVGYFDEGFAPYLGEDDDYYFRVRAERIKRGRVDIDVFHHGSATLNKFGVEALKKQSANALSRLREKYPNKRFQT